MLDYCGATCPIGPPPPQSASPACLSAAIESTDLALQTAGELCALVPEMTRFGVMKHLALLEDAGLVTTRREGRTKLHHLNPVPIGLVADRWISKYAEPFTRAMVGLRTGLERESGA